MVSGQPYIRVWIKSVFSMGGPSHEVPVADLLSPIDPGHMSILRAIPTGRWRPYWSKDPKFFGDKAVLKVYPRELRVPNYRSRSIKCLIFSTWGAAWGGATSINFSKQPMASSFFPRFTRAVPLLFHALNDCGLISRALS